MVEAPEDSIRRDEHPIVLEQISLGDELSK
jgi:hypothetical protein